MTGDRQRATGDIVILGGGRVVVILSDPERSEGESKPALSVAEGDLLLRSSGKSRSFDFAALRAASLRMTIAVRQRPMHPIHRLLQRRSLRLRERRSVLPQLELSIAIVQIRGDERDAPHRDPAGERLVEGAARGAPEFHVEGARGQAHAALGGGVVGVAHREVQPARGVPALAQPSAQPFGERAEDALQFAPVVGVGDQLVVHAAFIAHRGRQHRAVVDAVRVLVEGAAHPPERGAERRLAQGGHVADLVEVIVVQAFADLVGHVGQQRHRFRCEETGLVSRRHRPDERARFALHHRRGGGAHELVDGDPDGDGEAQGFTRLAGEAVGDVDR